MASGQHAGPSGHNSQGYGFRPPPRPQQSPPFRMDGPNAGPQFDIIGWYSKFISCHRYFLDIAQHEYGMQALAAFLNIQLPFQKQPFPVASAAAALPHAALPQAATKLPQFPPPMSSRSPAQNNPVSGYPQTVSLIPYIRRLIATGFDDHKILHGFFGDDWVLGIGSLHEIERRNYFFACKSTSWLETKAAYDLSEAETVPFLIPLKNVTAKELEVSEAAWSEWMAMQDWMLGPRAPGTEPSIKREMDDE